MWGAISAAQRPARRPRRGAAPARRPVGMGEEAVDLLGAGRRPRPRRRRPRESPLAPGSGGTRPRWPARRAANPGLSRKPASSRLVDDARRSAPPSGAWPWRRRRIAWMSATEWSPSKSETRSRSGRGQHGDLVGEPGGIAEGDHPLAVLLHGKRLERARQSRPCPANADAPRVPTLRGSSAPRRRKSCAASTISVDLDILVDLVGNQPVAGPARHDRDPELHPEDRAVGGAGDAAELRARAPPPRGRRAPSTGRAARRRPPAWRGETG